MKIFFVFFVFFFVSCIGCSTTPQQQQFDQLTEGRELTQQQTNQLHRLIDARWRLQRKAADVAVLGPVMGKSAEDVLVEQGSIRVAIIKVDAAIKKLLSGPTVVRKVKQPSGIASHSHNPPQTIGNRGYVFPLVIKPLKNGEVLEEETKEE